MALKLEDFAEVLRGLTDLPNPHHNQRQLLYIIEGGTIGNPYSLRAIADFLVSIDEYIDGAADLAEELAELAKEAGVKSLKGGTDVGKKKRDEEEKDELTDDDELEDDSEEEEDEEEEEEEIEDEDDAPPKKSRAQKAPAKKAGKKATKKAAAKKKAAKPKKAKKAQRSADRNAPVPEEERVPHVVTALSGMKDGGTINEVYHKLTRSKAGEEMFPTRRSVKRVLTHHEGEEFERSTATVWQVKAAKAKKAKAKKDKTKK